LQLSGLFSGTFDAGGNGELRLIGFGSGNPISRASARERSGARFLIDSSPSRGLAHQRFLRHLSSLYPFPFILFPFLSHLFSDHRGADLGEVWGVSFPEKLLFKKSYKYNLDNFV